MINLINSDCFLELSKIKNNSVNLICIDPPYGIIQGLILQGQKKKELKIFMMLMALKPS